ncbi:hypothetical protein [Pseudanabaena sp. 'Roaring Creek']|uniref:hypothetical protein n=1 Tax=Pseudanabaena sp. 'Roaring Creek' TaxID=1681830 RepID=UPI0006D7EC5A|nr:hypothetical protein [Pseudanabaena sp. 'Roaring Creek']
MTLGKHKIRGITLKGIKVLPASEFEQMMTDAQYRKTYITTASGDRWFVYFEHLFFGKVEAVYSRDKKIVITAYHPK